MKVADVEDTVTSVVDKLPMTGTNVEVGTSLVVVEELKPIGVTVTVVDTFARSDVGSTTGAEVVVRLAP